MGRTIYFNNHAFQKYNSGNANYEDIENGDVVVEQNPLVDQGGESNEDAEESTDDKADTTDNWRIV